MRMDQARSPLLQMKGISKDFGPTKALGNVDFDLFSGEVHALLGENGAGKSTLVKILSGALKPDGGRMLIGSRIFAPSGPLESRRHGISMIYQELNLAPHLSVEENIMLGREIRAAGILRRKEMRSQVRRVLESVQHPEISLEAPISSLSIGARQIVEIARALLEDAKILIMDEPTSSLSREDSERLFDAIKSLKGKGVGIIYISHFLEEVQRVADRLTVLRDGERVHSGPMSGMDLEKMIQMMVGRTVTEMFPRISHTQGKEILRLDSLKGKTMRVPVKLTLHLGEILGVAGLIGSGRTQTLRSIFGLDALAAGSLVIRDVSLTRHKPWQSIDTGMGFLSEDRQGEGLALGLSIADNLSLSAYKPYKRRGFLNLRERRRAARRYMDSMNVKAQGPAQPVSSLSGGNQQKVALARLVHQKADVFLLDEPTRGIDVVSKSQIYQWMGEQAARGSAILFVSSYLPELLGVCDRIAVFHRGSLVDIKPVEKWDEEAILASATVGTLPGNDAVRRS